MNISSWLVDTITIASASGTVTSSGRRNYDAQRTINVRLEHGTKLVADQQGAESEYEHVFAVDQEVKPTDRIWLPGDDTSGEHRSPIKIKRASTKPGSYTIWQVYL
jgi:hypothetical protein